MAPIAGALLARGCATLAWDELRVRCARRGRTPLQMRHAQNAPWSSDVMSGNPSHGPARTGGSEPHDQANRTSDHTSTPNGSRDASCSRSVQSHLGEPLELPDTTCRQRDV